MNPFTILVVAFGLLGRPHRHSVLYKTCKKLDMVESKVADIVKLNNWKCMPSQVT